MTAQDEHEMLGNNMHLTDDSHKILSFFFCGVLPRFRLFSKILEKKKFQGQLLTAKKWQCPELEESVAQFLLFHFSLKNFSFSSSVLLSRMKRSKNNQDLKRVIVEKNDKKEYFFRQNFLLRD